jgi:predicted nucleotidyltransferase component of viral defense system
MLYKTAGAFLMALEARLRQRSDIDRVDFQRLRKRVAFERFLSRLQAPSDSPWFLKGAVALDFRFGDRARTTQDLDLGLDLSLRGDPILGRGEILQLLREAATYPLHDFFVFSIPSEGQEILREPGAHAYRFTIRASLAARPFEDFRTDVGAGLQLVAPVEEIPESDALAFAGIVPGRFRTVSLAQHFAEKVHAYTRPWEGRENTRVKDLVDINLILEYGLPNAQIVRNVTEAVFAGRDTHPLPPHIPDPPVSWTGSYTALARETGLSCVDIVAATKFLRECWIQTFP